MQFVTFRKLLPAIYIDISKPNTYGRPFLRKLVVE